VANSARENCPRLAIISAMRVKAPESNTLGLLRAVTRGMVSLRLCVTCRLTRCRCLPCLLASQTALTPSAHPPSKPGLHHSHLPLLHERAMVSQAGRSAAPPADSRLVMPADVSVRAGTVEVLTVRPQNHADSIANAAKHFACAASRAHHGRSPGAPPRPEKLARRLASSTDSLSRRRSSPSAMPPAMMVTWPVSLRSSGSPGVAGRPQRLKFRCVSRTLHPHFKTSN
jgi:hypothetical protein